MKNETQSVAVIVRLLIDKSYCPTESGVPIYGSTIYALAVRNKAAHVLRHFITCSRCQKRINKGVRKKIKTTLQSSLFRNLYLQRELMDTQAIFKAKRLRGVLFKWHAHSPVAGSDIDLLVSPTDFATAIAAFRAKGYAIETNGRSFKEAHLIHPRRRTHIDLHFLVAYPHFWGLDEYDVSLLKRASQMCLADNRFTHFGLVHSSIEWFLVIKVIGYWYNDLLTGLGTLLSLMTTCSQYKDTIDWQKFLAVVESLSMKHEALFVLALGSRFFDIPLPSIIQRAMPLRVRMLAAIPSVESVSVFPPMQDWYLARYFRESQRRFLRFSFFKFTVRQRVPLLPLVKQLHLHTVRMWGSVLFHNVMDVILRQATIFYSRLSVGLRGKSLRLTIERFAPWRKAE